MDQPAVRPAFQIPTISVGWSILTVLLVLGFTFIYAAGDQNARDTLTFLVLASAVGAGSLSAYYVWCGLKTSVDQRNEIIRQERVNKAIAFLTRWNDGSNSEIRRKWLEILDEFEATPALAPTTLAADMDKRAIVTSVMNFCEEVAYSVRTQIADIDTVKKLFRGLFIRYFKAVKPWIDHRRRDNAKAWEQFEWLYDQWK